MRDSTFVADQLEAAWNEQEARLLEAAVSDDRAHKVDGHPAEQAIAVQLATELDGGRLTLCSHVGTAPQRLLWSPGMTVLGCSEDYTAHRAGAESTACHCCGGPVELHHGLMMFAAGPVLVVATVCADCRNAPLARAVAKEHASAIATVVRVLHRMWMTED